MSVIADEAQARAIAALPFVRIVTPALRSRRLETLPAEPLAPWPGMGGPPSPRPGSESPRVPGWQGSAPTLVKPINYGASFTPLTALNVIAAFDSGWSAATVTVGMFDAGFDKTHNATSPLLRIAEYDFVFHDGETANQPGDVTGAWDHGTGTWSVCGGYYPNNMVGPAYNARFLLAKTEDIRSETPVEEDNWVAAAEWADSIGVDVVSSSLAYLDFDGTVNDYTYSDLNGYTTVVTLGAIMAAQAWHRDRERDGERRARCRIDLGARGRGQHHLVRRGRLGEHHRGIFVARSRPRTAAPSPRWWRRGLRRPGPWRAAPRSSAPRAAPRSRRP